MVASLLGGAQVLGQALGRVPERGPARGVEAAQGLVLARGPARGVEAAQGPVLVRGPARVVEAAQGPAQGPVLARGLALVRADSTALCSDIEHFRGWSAIKDNMLARCHSPTSRPNAESHPQSSQVRSRHGWWNPQS
jgi:hypothetical protein